MAWPIIVLAASSRSSNYLCGIIFDAVKSGCPIDLGLETHRNPVERPGTNPVGDFWAQALAQ